jgi:hypothetical protein
MSGPNASGPRVLAFLVSSAGLMAAAVLLFSTWTGTDGVLSLRLSETVLAGSTVLAAGLAIFIVVKAGTEPANVSLALAIGFAGSVDTFGNVLFPLCGDSRFAVLAVRVILFIFGMGFFIRASQLFPRRLLPTDIAASPTLWGRVRLSRLILTSLLQPWVTWATVSGITVLGVVLPFTEAFALMRLGLILAGIAFFHISLRSGDEQARQKVLWFLGGVLAFFIIQAIALGIRIAVAGFLTLEMRTLLYLVLMTVQNLVVLAFFYAAVFHAGAVNPELVVRKTAVYGVTFAAMLFAFSAVEAVIADALVEYLGVTNGMGNAMIGTVFGLAFHPLTKRVERLLGRFGRGDPAGSDSTVPAESR